MDSVSMKTCRKCEEHLPLDAFYRNAQSRDGKTARCKVCLKEDATISRQRNTGSAKRKSGAARRKSRAERDPAYALELATLQRQTILDLRSKYSATPAQRKAAKSRRSASALEFLANLKNERGCVDCGFRGLPDALHFDHLPQFQKVHNVSYLARCGTWQQILDEVAKCEIVCANCHAVRTRKRRLVV